ncbi:MULTISPECIES: helix-turn-helix domain-containing protein [Caulobacter]|jgi:CRP/FNR family nitrogen fixation transcriptional regulator|uniref:Transcriptional regulator, Crp/Fnr family n=1 Tax=Caulobacter vibrioides OR37 TaxID=1292034 RepID=R0CZW0_CAUVI|nr:MULTISPECIES: helix-turn-helix domain-containing protein [Caulobacter]ENZ81770.1 transcriptional regulator, Crp/Fnr family [Caulobacter vibrioides OR37]MBQ1560203.1 helix-turn-helix domain-containing protein [Caulobacter sp.]
MLSPIRAKSFDTDHLFDAALPTPGACLRLTRDEEIFGEGEDADYIYQVVSGSVRTYRILRDGRRQVDAFLFAGDYFGWEMGEAHRVTAEAMCDTSVRMIRRGALSDLVARRGDAARAVFHLTAEGLQRSQDHVLMLGRRSAIERVVGLLLDIAQRTRADAEIDVPMGRQDMADYLGLTIETVSRALTSLQDEGLIALPTVRHVVLKDRRALERMVL